MERKSSAVSSCKNRLFAREPAPVIYYTTAALGGPATLGGRPTREHGCRPNAGASASLVLLAYAAYAEWVLPRVVSLLLIGH